MGSGLREAGPAVLHLVDCSLLVPPRTGQDGRARYPMLETLRGYGLERLAEAMGWERQDFKLHVRRLKGLGLTLSLDVGYRLSPRGESYLRHLAP